MKKSWLVWWLLLAIFLWILWNTGQQAQKKRQQQILSNCENVFPDDTILVCMVSHQDAISTAHTLVDLYKKAYCPHRIFVAIVQFFGPLDQIDALQKYQETCRLATDTDFSDNIRIMSLKAVAGKPQNGLFFIQHHLYAREKYLLQLHSESVLLDEWDKLAIEELESCPNTQKPVLTQFPLNLPENATKRMPTFVRWLKDGYVEGLLFKKRPKTPVPASFWCSDFVFSYADRFTGMPEFRDRILDDYASGLKAFTSGFDMFYPRRLLVEPGIDRQPVRKILRSGSATFDIGYVRDPSLYESFCGVSRTGQPNAMGLAGFNSGQPETEQVRQKYGSRKNPAYLSALVKK